ncbi:MAG: signal peptidase I [Planctomycetes bacterium]|nr:signal peptidase I [Planctomycetota bacterium]
MKNIRFYVRVAVISAVLLVMAFVGTRYSVHTLDERQAQGISTKSPGSVQVVVKTSNRIRDLALNDVILFRPPDTKAGVQVPWAEMLLSRVVAFPGDRVRIARGELAVNGSRPDQTDYVSAKQVSDEVEMPEITVPRGHLFVLNDVRRGAPTGARDSRRFGPIPEELVVCKLLFR